MGNYHASARKLELREQLPRSRREEIKVKEMKLEPKPEAADETKPGLRVWKLELPSKNQTTVYFRYQVKWPSNKRIRGME